MKNLIPFFIVLFLFLFSEKSLCERRYVKHNAMGANNGTSWENAFPSVQPALDAASSGDEIWVAAGTYYPTNLIDGGDPRTACFQLINGVAIYGGFNGTEINFGERSLGSDHLSILSGDIGTPGNNLDNCYHVFYLPSGLGLTAAAVLDGFTIQDGNANGTDPHIYGGGIYSNNNIFTLKNCTIKNNTAIHANSWGGGILLMASSDVVIENCIIADNTSSWDGGGIHIVDSSPTLTNCLITGNSSKHGAGIYLFRNSSPIFNNVTIANNNSISGGGGVWAYDDTPSGVEGTFNNCIFWGNTLGSEYINQIVLGGGINITLNYSCYYNNNNEGVWGTGVYTFTATNHNTNSDPQFVDAAAGDFRILGTSPCADAGNDSYNSQEYDIRGCGYPRNLNKGNGEIGTIDMGAYEYLFSNDPMPVELTFFTASISDNIIILNWQTATEVNNYGFTVERLAKSLTPPFVKGGTQGGWEKVGFIEGAGNSNSPKEYSFTDNLSNLSNLSNFKYRLKQIDNDGTFTYSQTVEVKINNSPAEFELYQNYPNPFNPTTQIGFSLPEKSFVRIEVYNSIGKKIAVLVNETKETGNHQVEWNSGSLPSGIYFYTIHAKTEGDGKDFRSTKKMLMIK